MNNLAQIFKALGDETRLKIVEMLLGKELCVCDILASFDKTQPVISHHLKVLKYAGLVTDSRDGKWIYYSLSPAAFETVARLVDQLKQGLYTKERQACPANANRYEQEVV